MSESITVHTGDCFDVLEDIEAESVHAVVTDPPYGLAFMGREWDDFEPKEYQEWCEEWAAKVKRVLKPGGHLLAFSGNRTHHRLFAGVEDAGYEIRDTITWHYGSGFPKALDVSKAIDKQGGNPELSDTVAEELQNARERRGISITEADELFCDGSSNYSWFEGRPKGQRIPSDDIFRDIVNEWGELQPLFEKVRSADREVIETKTDGADRTIEIISNNGDEYEVTVPETDAAAEWGGFKTALKPATEYVVVARKPLSEGTVAENVLAHGTGALNIDGTRVGSNERPERQSHAEDSVTDYGDGLNGSEANGTTTEGRYPSNVVFDEPEAERLDSQNDTTTSKDGGVSTGFSGEVYADNSDEYAKNQQTRVGYEDMGGPSRYFYTSKASKSERTQDGRLPNDHPTVKPLDLMEWLVTLATAEGQTVLDPFCGSGTTLRAAKDCGRGAIGIERQPEYADLARARAGLTPETPGRFVDEDATTLDAYTDGGDRGE